MPQTHFHPFPARTPTSPARGEGAAGVRLEIANIWHGTELRPMVGSLIVPPSGLQLGSDGFFCIWETRLDPTCMIYDAELWYSGPMGAGVLVSLGTSDMPDRFIPATAMNNATGGRIAMPPSRMLAADGSRIGALLRIDQPVCILAHITGADVPVASAGVELQMRLLWGRT